MEVKDVMTRHVKVIGPEATLEEAASVMATFEIGMLPVVEGNKVVGVVTDRDITVRATGKGLSPTTAQVKAVMTTDVVTCFEDETIQDAGAKMANHRVRRVVVLSRGRELVGLASLDDLAVDADDSQLAGAVLQHVATKPAQHQGAYRNIVVALDGSERAERVLPFVEPLVEKFGASITLLRAITPIESALYAETSVAVGDVPTGVTTADVVQITEEMRLDTVKYLTAMQQRLAKQGFSVEVDYPEGGAATAILRRARHVGADLIAMTTHGRSGLGRALLGSVADEVVRRAPCPVLLIRAS